MPGKRALRDNAWWQQRSARERAVLTTGTLLLVGVLACTWVLVPMLDTVAQAPLNRALRKQRLADATTQVQLLRTAAPPVASRSDPRAAAERALRERNLLGNGTTVDVQDGRVLVTLPAVALADLVPALTALERSDGLRAVATTLTPRADAGVRAEVTLAR